MLDLHYQMSDFEEAIASFISDETGFAAVVKVRQALAGGGSRDTWLLDARVDGRPETLVLRKDLDTEIFEYALPRDVEFDVLEMAYEQGVMVPRPRWLCMDEEYLGQPFFLMDYVEGVSLGVKLVKDPNLRPLHAQLPIVLGEQLAKIHALDKQDDRLSVLSRPQSGRNAAQQALYQFRQILDRLEIHNPTIEFGLRWLEQNAPPTADICLLHGDYRVGNFILNQQGLQAIIDWEFVHLGDPHEDLAWGCVRDWRFGNPRMHFGGISPREVYIQAYEQASGRTIDRPTLDYWEIVGNMGWAVTCLSQAGRTLFGGESSVEFASLGRRSAEMQLEFLRLIQAKGL
jgi:aminoglycoside phosphotransferase (APT) family kinase protein